MSDQISELRIWVASGNQVPGNVSVTQGTQIIHLKINNAGMMGGSNSRRQQRLEA